MNRCEDYPCCGHGSTPYGDGSGCPDVNGRFDCVLCGNKLVRGSRSSACRKCLISRQRMSLEDCEYQDEMREE